MVKFGCKSNKKNSDFRESQEEWKESIDKIIEEHKSLVRWKNTIQKVLIAILTASGAVASFILSKYLG